jgi:hypothetical protein
MFVLHAVGRLDFDWSLSHLGPVGGEDGTAAFLKRFVHGPSETKHKNELRIFLRLKQNCLRLKK